MFKELFGGMRALVLLRQIARELARANELTELRLEIEHSAWYKARVIGKQKGPAKSGKKGNDSFVSTPSVAQWNELYSKLHPPEDVDNPY